MCFSIKIKGSETEGGTKISSKFWATQPLLEIEKEFNLGIHVPIGRTKIGEGLYP